MIKDFTLWHGGCYWLISVCVSQRCSRCKLDFIQSILHLHFCEVDEAAGIVTVWPSAFLLCWLMLVCTALQSVSADFVFFSPQTSQNKWNTVLTAQGNDFMLHIPTNVEKEMTSIHLVFLLTRHAACLWAQEIGLFNWKLLIHRRRLWLSLPAKMLDWKFVSLWKGSWCLLTAQVWCLWWHCSKDCRARSASGRS